MAYQSGRTGSPVDASKQDSKAERTSPTKIGARDFAPNDLNRGGRAGDRSELLANHYSRNGYSGPSSLPPGTRIEQAGARLATNFDPDLEAVRTGAFGVGDQLRAIGDKNVPVHWAHQKRGVADGSPGGAVPDGTDKGATENPVRVPTGR
jgi:hypothetical protein